MSTNFMSMALTEEEEYLLARYKILKEKRRMLQKLKEKVETKTKPAVKREAQEITQTPEDARKKAVMLVACGHVKIAKTTVEREFKRARITEKRVAKEPLSDNDTPASAEKMQANKLAMKEMYNSRFVKAGSNNDRNTGAGFGYRGYGEHRKGNTIFVKGFGLKEDILKTAFNKFGTVVEVKFEKDRSHGFVAFETFEAAEKAIGEMNGMQISGVNIQVCLARKQRRSEGSRENRTVFTSRDHCPEDHPEKMPESRKLQSYSDDDFF